MPFFRAPPYDPRAFRKSSTKTFRLGFAVSVRLFVKSKFEIIALTENRKGHGVNHRPWRSHIREASRAFGDRRR